MNNLIIKIVNLVTMIYQFSLLMINLQGSWILKDLSCVTINVSKFLCLKVVSSNLKLTKDWYA